MSHSGKIVGVKSYDKSLKIIMEIYHLNITYMFFQVLMVLWKNQMQYIVFYQKQLMNYDPKLIKN